MEALSDVYYTYKELHHAIQHVHYVYSFVALANLNRHAAIFFFFFFSHFSEFGCRSVSLSLSRSLSFAASLVSAPR